MEPHDPSGLTLPGHPDASHLDRLPLAAVAVDRDGTVRYLNAAASRLYGRSPEELLGLELVTVVFSEEERGAAQEVLAQAAAGEAWTGDLSVRTPTVQTVPVQMTATPLRHDQRIVGALLVAQDATPQRSRSRQTSRLGDRLTRLARVAAELVVAESTEAVTRIVISHAADAAGATIASLSLLTDKETLVLKGLRGGLEGAATRWATYSVHANTPASEAVRTGRQVLLVGNEQIRRRYPELESAAPGERTMICLPLRVAGRSIGAISLSFPGLRHLDVEELEFLGILADICAQALDRIQAVADAADKAGKLQFLANASAELASSLDYQATLKNVAWLAVPRFADWCAIALAEDGDLHTLAVAHVDPAKVALAEELQQRFPPDRDAAQGQFHVMRTGISELIPDISDEMLEAAISDPEHLRLAKALELRSALVVPLVARGRVLGVVTWVSGEGGRRFSEADIAFGEDLARRAAVAIDNAQLHSETSEVAVRLQEAVLPDRTPDIAGWDLATHYSPAGRTDVGGDFYDLIHVDGGRVAMFVGDVMGRGVAAAAAMAQIRATVRAYLAIDPDPVSVLHKLDLMFARYDITSLVTLVYALAIPAEDRLQVLNAGHPPPVVVRADRSVVQLPADGGAPLGLVAAPRTPIQVRLGVGDTVLAFTDGLIERRTEDIDVGQRRLVEEAPRIMTGPLQVTLESLVERVRDHTREDDIAALAARRLS